MAASELNNRLDYLISYSSQLVFVCSEKIAQKSQLIESFLTQQSEQADLALLTAHELTPLVSYREKLFRQLISPNLTADFSRPLNQLLAPLNNQTGAILINIYQADKLPNKLVKELWDLVLQSRFAKNKHLLNVLLIGDSEWAESTKLSLGCNTKDQPIVLNTQIEFQYPETHEFSDLESFLQNTRQQFAQRVQERQVQLSESKPKPRLNKLWIKLTFGLIFLGLFAVIVNWQYPLKIKDMQSYFATKIVTPKPLSNASKDTISKKPVTNTGQEVEPQVVSTAPLTSTKDILITDWSSASAKLVRQPNHAQLASNIIEHPKDIQAQPSQEQALQSPNLNPNLQRQTRSIQGDGTESRMAAITKHQPALLEKANITQERNSLQTEPSLLLALPTEHFVIQIAAMANLQALQDFVAIEQLSHQLWLYKTQRYGADWFVLVKNQDFASMEEARVAITQLHASLRLNAPFVKSLRQVKQEISITKS
ncbi:DamX protein [uncultured Paraglaciecola sp.]|uniref:DamX protein n=1 Tax=uncultured Paraglaciecola sp. TaxID=1765024 RepID=UPI00262D7CBF|nr:DamX protein [uncultured Paraglaciecola sp.]